VAAEDSQEDQDPGDDHPARKEIDDHGHDHEKQQALRGLDAPARRKEGLPEEEEPEMHQHPGAHEGAAGLRKQRAVEREQHRRHDPALGTREARGCRGADVGCRIHGQRAV
jgi:hypothetical protein